MLADSFGGVMSSFLNIYIYFCSEEVYMHTSAGTGKARRG